MFSPIFAMISCRRSFTVLSGFFTNFWSSRQISAAHFLTWPSKILSRNSAFCLLRCLGAEDVFFPSRGGFVDVGLGHELGTERGDVHRDVTAEVLELVVAGHEIGFRVHFEQHADATTGVDVRKDRTFGRDAARFLGGLAEALGAQPSMAFSMSPATSCKAFLQSIMPAPVFSRRSRTSVALIDMITPCPWLRWCRRLCCRRRSTLPRGAAVEFHLDLDVFGGTAATSLRPC